MTAWIFQGNPDHFDVDAYLRRDRAILWTVRQEHYAKDMAVGDGVFIWRSAGKARGRAGIVAIGKITEAPRERPDSDEAIAFWKDAESGHRSVLRVGIKLDPQEGGRLLHKKTIAATDALKELVTLKMANQTNYPVSPTQEAALVALWSRSGVPSSRT